MRYLTETKAFRLAEQSIESITVEYWTGNKLVATDDWLEIEDLAGQIEENSPICGLTVWFD